MSNISSTAARPLSEINQLQHFGQRFPLVPRKHSTKLKVSLLFARRLYQKIGLGSYLWFWLSLGFKFPGIIRRNQEGLSLMKSSFGGFARLQWILLIAIYERLSRSFGKAEAYQFVKDCIQEGSRYMMAEFYEAEELAKFDDPYAAFWEYHKAMFRGDDNFDNELIEGDDCHRMIVHNCRSCAIAQLTISELGPMGCDHDITGFEAISEQIQMDFRRPTTLAKDGKPCEFMFFRKGTAPEGLETK